MFRFTKNEFQLIQPNQSAILDGTLWSRSILHQDDSGIVTLRGIVGNPFVEFAAYFVEFRGNIAVPTGGTAAPISVSLARNGQIIPTTRAIFTPAAADDYGFVACADTIIVPRGWGAEIAVVNSSESATPATTPAPAINLQNASLLVVRVA